MDHPLRTDVETVRAEPSQIRLTANVDKEEVEARLKFLLSQDPVLAKLNESASAREEGVKTRESKKQAKLQEKINTLGKQLSLLHSEMRALRGSVARRKTATEKLIAKRHRFLKKIAAAQVEHERTKQFRKNIQ